MADPEHVALLEAGVQTWNAWRYDNKSVRPDLSGAEFRGANLHEADLRRANLSNADLDRANLSNADFSGADLTGASHRATDLSHTDLTKTDLTGAHLTGAIISDADLTGADLTGARLGGASLYRANLGGATISRASFSNIILADTNLSQVEGLHEIFHDGPSIIEHRTLMGSGRLPNVFLRGCGLPDRLIEYLPALLDQPIQLYSCFISFTEADDTFSEQLYNDLQGKGVRCWRWKEDARGGRSLIGDVDRAVRLYDKLIVVCSEDSLRSNPVIREIERALQREDRLVSQGETPEVLFPIRLDDSIFDWDHPRQADVVEKVISDFRDWRDHDSYQASFAKLLRDLRLDT